MIAWDEKYRVGHKELDEDHRELFAYINRINTALEEKEADGECLKVLDELLEYTKHHFSREEEYMESRSYSQLAGHRESHSRLTSQVRELRSNLGEKRDIIRDTVSLLEIWITQHIMLADRHYALELEALPV